VGEGNATMLFCLTRATKSSRFEEAVVVSRRRVVLFGFLSRNERCFAGIS
jgi:hypothetical protein